MRVACCPAHSWDAETPKVVGDLLQGPESTLHIGGSQAGEWMDGVLEGMTLPKLGETVCLLKT